MFIVVGYNVKKSKANEIPISPISGAYVPRLDGDILAKHLKQSVRSLYYPSVKNFVNHLPSSVFKLSLASLCSVSGDSGLVTVAIT